MGATPGAGLGAADDGGVLDYKMGRGPGGWSDTYRDAHPDRTRHDGLFTATVAYGPMVKALNPSAKVPGPGDFVMHYQCDGKPGDRAREHGGMGQGDYSLGEMEAWQVENGSRLLDYSDEHYYQAPQVGQSEGTVLGATHSLWDPNPREENWTGRLQGPIRRIPRFRESIDRLYPATNLSLSAQGGLDYRELVGVLASADVPGSFGHEGLDLACIQETPKATDPAASGQVCRYGGKGLGSILRQRDVLVASGAAACVFPARSIMLVAIPRS